MKTSELTAAAAREARRCGGRAVTLRADGRLMVASGKILDDLEYSGAVACYWCLTAEGRLVSVPVDERG